MYCLSCDTSRADHFTSIGGTYMCTYQEIREVLWLAKIRNEEGDLR